MLLFVLMIDLLIFVFAECMLVDLDLVVLLCIMLELVGLRIGVFSLIFGDI